MDLTSIKKILVIKLRYIGDVLLSTPVIENLRVHFPDAYITMIVNQGTDDVLRYNPYINKIITFDRTIIKGGLFERIISSISYIRKVRDEHFDLVIDLTDGDRGAILSFLSGARIRLGYNAEKRIRGKLYTSIVKPSGSKIHNVDYQLEAIRTLGLSIETKSLQLNWSIDEDRFIDRLICEKGLSNRPFLTVHPGARWWFKKWPMKRFALLSEMVFDEYGIETVFLGGKKEEDDLKEISRHLRHTLIEARGLTLLQMAALIKRSLLFIGNDNGPMHIAAAVRTPVIAIFGSSDPVLWGPWGDGHRILYKGVECSPCDHTGCDKGDFNCMQQIHLSEVKKDIDKVLQIRRVVNESIP